MHQDCIIIHLSSNTILCRSHLITSKQPELTTDNRQQPSQIIGSPILNPRHIPGARIKRMVSNNAWADLLETQTLSFIIQAGVDILPTPANLHRWKIQSDPSCKLWKPPMHCQSCPEPLFNCLKTKVRIPGNMTWYYLIL